MKKLETNVKKANKPLKRESSKNSTNNFFPKSERIRAQNPVNINGVKKKNS
jgi:hypothetical protein